MDYSEFLYTKIPEAQRNGFAVNESEINPMAFPHQRDTIRWAIIGGRRAVFASFGLGKSLIQLEICRIILQHEGGKALIVCPLGVRQEFTEDARKLTEYAESKGLDVAKFGITLEYVTTTEQALASKATICITNYERVRDGGIDPTVFTVASLDEASVLRGYGTKTFQEFLQKFPRTKYRYVCTATPAPNRFKELIHYSEFLGIMDGNESITRFFQRDNQKAGNLTLHPHKEREFWLWMTTWALFITKPSDLGYSDLGYDLPELRMHYHKVDTDGLARPVKVRDVPLLFEDMAMGLQDASIEKRISIPQRLNEFIQILLSFEHANKRTIQSLVREKQRSFAGKATLTKQEELRGKQACISCKSEKVGGEQPGQAAGTQKGSRGKEQGQTIGKIENLLHEKPRTAIGGCEGTKVCKDGDVERGCRSTEGSSAESLCYMRDLDGGCGDEKTSDRSLPQERESQSAPMPPLQCWSGGVYGLPRTPENCGTLFGKQSVIWVTLDAEQREVERALKKLGVSYSSIDGKQPYEQREIAFYAWKDGLTECLVSKPKILGSGCNLQQSCKMVFLGIDYKANDFLQAIHREVRFGQHEAVDIHVVYTDTEEHVLNTLKEKWANHIKMVKNMTDIVKQYGLAKEAISTELGRTLGLPRHVSTGENWTAVNNDCVEECKLLESDSVDLIHTSIPFSNLYEFSLSYNDFGHNSNNEEFFKQMNYLTPEMLRILRPGRVAAIHVKDRVIPGATSGLGMSTIDPFHAHAIAHYMSCGFLFIGMVTVETDVVRENNKTYRLGWSEQCKDGSKMGVGCPEYILLFRKKPTDTSNAYADIPVVKDKSIYTRGQWQIDARAKWNSSGDRLITSEELAELEVDLIEKKFKAYIEANIYNYTDHVSLANALDAKGNLPATFETFKVPARNQEVVWHDVMRFRTLNSDQARRNLQAHVSPLQIDIVDRVITRYSNPGELVLDPFGGIMTVPYRAVKLGRKGYGVELNPDYWRDGLGYLQACDEKIEVPSLFDTLS